MGYRKDSYAPGPPSRRFQVYIDCPECEERHIFDADYEGDTGATNIEIEPDDCPNCGAYIGDQEAEPYD